MDDNKQIKKSKGSFRGLIPLVVFLVLFFSVGIITGDFSKLPILVGVLIATAVAFCIKAEDKEKRRTFEEKMTIFCKGAGEHTLVLMIVIFILAGAFYGVAGSMGAVDSVKNIGLTILPANMILPGIFMVACILSFSMGTSMGTIGAVIPIAIGIAQAADINVALTCGAAVGGAMFGDNLSFISDTTIAATRTQGVAMKDKFKANILMVLPAVIVNLILLALVPVDPAKITEVLAATAGDSVFAIDNLIKLLPYIVVITLSLIGVHVAISLSASIAVGLVVGWIQGSFTLVESFGLVHMGITSMTDTAMIAIVVGGLVKLMQDLGGIEWLLHKLTARTKTAKGGELSIAALVSLLDMATTNNTVAIIAAGPIAKDISQEYGIAPQRVASILDIFAAAFSGLVPYASQLLAVQGLLIVAGLNDIGATSVMFYNWYALLMLVFGIIFILLGFPKFKNKSANEEKVAA
ncbi:Na+/H+ antiporter NhaC family protein [Candidatus Epulonipiscium viviparus]|uniref:Na+/H+ antiporter NhaC family protein n=1 Tax=Candidatus Epulonipiscium viviparus TaxID=420336 RepID=UPI00049670C6|nr:Na+/H+ antiporter NhaC family protein [Candidatus Epulopiscium viviparus]